MKMCEELITTFATLNNESPYRTVVIRGAGPTFSAGVDIKELSEKPTDWVMKRRNYGLDAFLAIERCPLPVIGVVHGAVFGAGAEIAAACDFLIATDSAVFQWPEALRGAVGATQRLPRTVGRQMAKELLFTARKISALEALSIGFVNHVVPSESLTSEIENTVASIERCGPVAIRLIKQAINLGENRDRVSAIDLERQFIAQSLLHDEWKSAVDDFHRNPRS